MIDLAEERREIEAHLAEVSDEEFERELEEAGAVEEERCGNCGHSQPYEYLDEMRLICTNVADDSPSFFVSPTGHGCENWISKAHARTCGNCGHSLMNDGPCSNATGACEHWAAYEPVTPACERCAFASEPRNVLTKTGFGKDSEDPVYSNLAMCECRKHAPSVLISTDRQNMDAYHAIWPLVRPGGWCGEWKARGGK